MDFCYGITTNLAHWFQIPEKIISKSKNSSMLWHSIFSHCLCFNSQYHCYWNKSITGSRGNKYGKKKIRILTFNLKENTSLFVFLGGKKKKVLKIVYCWLARSNQISLAVMHAKTSYAQLNLCSLCALMEYLSIQWQLCWRTVISEKYVRAATFHHPPI